MNTASMLDEGASFLTSCFQADKVGSVFTVEHSFLPQYYFQVYVCGIVHRDGSESVNGELQTHISGPENIEVSDAECLQRFDRLLKSGWSNEGGNAERIFGPFSEKEQVKTLLQTAADLLAAVYGLEEADWKLEFYQEGK